MIKLNLKSYSINIWDIQLSIDHYTVMKLKVY